MIKLAEKINSLNEELEAFDGFISLELHPNTKTVSVHMRERNFAEYFSDYRCRDFGVEPYKAELYNDINGVHFFALSTNPFISEDKFND